MNNDNGYSDILKIEPGIWSSIHSDIKKNIDYLHNKKMMYMNMYIDSKFTSNYDLMPRIPFPVTSFFITMLSTFYNNGTRFSSMNEGNDLKGVSEVSLRFALDEFQKSRFLNDVAFIRIRTGVELEFEHIIPTDIVYNYSFTKICLRKEQLEDQLSVFEYFEYKDGRWYRFEFTDKDFFSAPYDDMLNMENETRKNMKATPIEKWKTCPIIPLFANPDKYAYPSIFVAFDEVFNTLISFGLAGAPMSLLVKIFIKNNSINNNKDKYKAFGDLLTLLELDQDDDVGKVDTGELGSLKNFFVVFEASLAWLGRMVGLPVNVVSSQMNETRKSGSAKLVDNGASDIFRSSYLSQFDEFEYRLFKACKILQPKMKDFNFKPIDKSNLRLMQDGNTYIDNLIKEVRNSMTPYIEAIAKKYNVTLKEAEKIAEDVKNQMEKYFPDKYKDGLENSVNKGNNINDSKLTSFGIKKGVLDKNNAKNIVEDN